LEVKEFLIMEVEEEVSLILEEEVESYYWTM
jgi:hypothetical protein